jgi:exportin-T
LALYLQGAGALKGQMGRDGKEKRDTDVRMFCQQVVDHALMYK